MKSEVLPSRIRTAVARAKAIRAEAASYFQREPFEPIDPPLTRDQMLARETAMMTESNWREDHTVPSGGEHYRYLWNWDSRFASIINARRDDPDRARTELLTMEQYRDKDTGFLSNKITATAEGTTFRDYPEVWTFNKPEIGSSYTQPPLGAMAAMETYRSFMRQGREAEAKSFLEDIYGTVESGNYTGLQGEYAYFRNHRENAPDDPLIFNVHPNETGRDFDPALGPNIIFFPGEEKRHVVANSTIRWLAMQGLGHQIGHRGRDPEGQRVDWLPEKVREKYAVNDVMFNVLYAANLQDMAQISEILGKDEQQGFYADLADSVQEKVIEKMWDQKNGFFYNLDKQGKKIPVDSITGLFGLMIDKLPSQMVGALLDKVESPEWFATPYPLPTHPRRSKFYDPEFRRKQSPNWEGPVWINMNWSLTEKGLVKQAARFLDTASPDYNEELGLRCLRNAAHIVEKTQELQAINDPTRELFNPETGQGMRVREFMWSNLGLHFDEFEAASAKYGFAEENIL